MSLHPSGESAPAPRARPGHHLEPGGIDQPVAPQTIVYQPGIKPRRHLVWRLFIVNTTVIVIAYSVLAFSPLTVKSPLRPLQGGVFSLVGLLAVTAVNTLVIRRSLGPLVRLTEAMRHVDPLRPGERVVVSPAGDEVTELGMAFNEMLRRLEDERRESVRRILLAQEAERVEVARDLHDEIGQRLTALLLQLDYLAAESPGESLEAVEHARENARGTLEEVRRLARSLRPEVLDELGLASALRDLADRFDSSSHVAVTNRIERGLPDLSRDAELVVYRVAQESLTNVMRHADATHVTVELSADDGHVSLRVADDGGGIREEPEGAGIKGMRERAVLIGARLLISAHGGGVEVRLDVPV
jgi:two-component system sensor histidine kinase UhpB